MVTVPYPQTDIDITIGTLRNIYRQAEVARFEKKGTKMRFALALHTDDGVTYGVTVPDLPGCFSAGKNLDHAIEMAAEAIDLHVEGLIDAGETLPSPKSLTEHNADPLLSDAIWVFVDVPVHGETYSSFLMRAALQTMAQ